MAFSVFKYRPFEPGARRSLTDRIFTKVVTARDGNMYQAPRLSTPLLLMLGAFGVLGGVSEGIASLKDPNVTTNIECVSPKPICDLSITAHGEEILPEDIIIGITKGSNLSASPVKRIDPQHARATIGYKDVNLEAGERVIINGQPTRTVNVYVSGKGWQRENTIEFADDQNSGGQ